MPRSSWSAPSDEELLDRCRSGDSDAFAELWERHRRAGIVAARNLAPRFSPDDLVSEAYLRIFELTRDGRGPRGAFRPYLYQVIRSIAADWWRLPEYTTEALDEIPALTEAGPWEDGAFDLNAASQAFSTLTERWQAVLWYTEVEGLPPREAAKLLGISANGVSALAARAREALQSAWVEAHVNRELAAAACRSTLQHLQRYQRGKLTRAASRDVAAHLETCDSCSKAAAEYSALNRQLALVIAGVLLGAGPALALLEGLGPVAAASAAVSSAGATSTGTGAAGTASGGTAAGTAAIGASAGLIAAPAVLITAAVAAVAIGGTALLMSGVLRSSDPRPAAEATTVSAPPATADPAGPADADTGKASPVRSKPDTQSSREEPGAVSGASASASSDASASARADGDAGGSGGSGGSGSGGSGSGADGRAGGSSTAAADGTASGNSGSRANANSGGDARSGARADSASDANGADADSGSGSGSDSSASANASGGADADGADADADGADADGADATGDSDASGGETPAFLFDSGCWTRQGDAAHYYIWGRTSEPGTVRARVTQAPQAPVLLPEAMETQRKNWWWSSHPLTPFSQWDGLVDGELHDAVVEIQLSTADGRQTPWTAIEPNDADCLP